MTRITNFGRKRTYLQSRSTQPETTETKNELHQREAEDQPRKRKKIDSQNTGNDKAKIPNAEKYKAGKRARHGKSVNSSDESLRRSEIRRLKRMSERHTNTICFACREKGHSAKDCPKQQESANSESGKKIVGICYRCGSQRHTLSRCKKPVDESNPLPFASCFVCSQTGHLASSCSQNGSKGIYPNGGSCKLCGETSHLAKDCGLRKRDTIESSMVMGLDQTLGADEDDFHSFKRRKTEVDHGLKREDKLKKLSNIRTGAHSGITKAFGVTSAPKKVVYF